MKEGIDILLIYASEDNEPIEGMQHGWVSNFHKFLQNLLSQLQKDESAITMIDDSVVSADEIGEASSIIVIATPNLAQKDPVVKMLNTWATSLKKKGELIKDGSSRILKVRKSNFDADTVFTSLANLISYDLFFFDGTSGKTMEYTRFFGSDSERGYWMKLIDIAYDLITINESEGKKKVAKTEVSREKTIYLASTGLDLLTQRDVIKRELRRHGYEVLPSRSLPKETEELEKMVREDLSRCRMSIHMVGEDYGYKPADSDLSVVEIQNSLADEFTAEMSDYNRKHNNDKPFSRLVWLSPDLKNVSERQRIFIEDIKSKAALLDEAEVLQIQLQELKSIIKEELLTGGRISFMRSLEEADSQSGEGGQQVYLITDKEDLKASKKLSTFLEKQGLRVLYPAFEGDVADIRTVHQENLRRCDGSIIYYGNANIDWIKTKLSDLLKAPGMGRSKPLKVKAIYTSEEKPLDQEHLNKTKTMLLSDDGSLKPDRLAPFISQLNH